MNNSDAKQLIEKLLALLEVKNHREEAVEFLLANLGAVSLDNLRLFVRKIQGNVFTPDEIEFFMELIAKAIPANANIKRPQPMRWRSPVRPINVNFDDSHGANLDLIVEYSHKDAWTVEVIDKQRSMFYKTYDDPQDVLRMVQRIFAGIYED